MGTTAGLLTRSSNLCKCTILGRTNVCVQFGGSKDADNPNGAFNGVPI